MIQCLVTSSGTEDWTKQVLLLPFNFNYTNIILLLKHDRQAPTPNYLPSRTLVPQLFPQGTTLNLFSPLHSCYFLCDSLLTNPCKTAVCPFFIFSLLCLFFTFCLLMLEYKRARILCLLSFFLLMDSGI